MTNDMMNVRSLVEKSADADLLREMIGFAAERLMELEVRTPSGSSSLTLNRKRVTLPPEIHFEANDRPLSR